MRVNFEIDTIKIMTEELRKSLSNEIEPASISLLKSAVKNTDRTERLFNKCLTPDE